MHESLPDWLVDSLVDYEKIQSIPQAFSDSTHQLWCLQESTPDQSNHFLKVCCNTESPFWQIMLALFDFDLRTEIANFSCMYAFIAKTSCLEIPRLIKAETLDESKSYILTSELIGSAAGSYINDEMVQQLASHLACLHSNPISKWGSINSAEFNSFDWSNRLEIVLRESAKKYGGVTLHSDEHLESALLACNSIKAKEFVPLMPDLRWDQFLEYDDSISSLVDLDAFVFAPRELDFVILELIVCPAQIGIFRDAYEKNHTIPEIKNVRPAYRLLLFYMQVLGETDLDEWMNKESFF